MGCVPTLAMLAVQAGFAGMNLFSKLSLDTGTSPFVLIACRSFIAAGTLAPIALYYERNLWATMTRRVILEIFISTTLGMSLSELLNFLGFQSTSPTVASALGNLVPALTFLIAAAAKMETLRLGTRAGQAKVARTVVCLGGSMVMLFCKGPLLRIWASPLHWRYAEVYLVAEECPPQHGADHQDHGVEHGDQHGADHQDHISIVKSIFPPDTDFPFSIDKESFLSDLI